MITDRLTCFLSIDDVAQGKESIKDIVARRMTAWIIEHYDMFTLYLSDSHIIATYPAEDFAGQYVEIEFTLREITELVDSLQEVRARLPIGL